MNDLLICVPSRGRPDNAVAFLAALRESGDGADVVFGLDVDDDELSGYLTSLPVVPHVWSVTGASVGMCATLNDLALRYAPYYRYIGFAGDDHRFRGENPCARITDALDALGTGLCYGNDLVHGEALPTAVFMTSDIVRALGYMAPPTLRHLFLDNFWRTLGEQTGALTYLPGVIIEHVHPIAQKAEWDEGYERVNAPEMYEHDRAAFEQWQSSQMALDVAKVRALRAVRA